MTPRQLLIVVVAVGLFTAMSVAPVAAGDNGTDDLIDIDDDGVGVGVGPDDGVEAGIAGEELSDGAPADVVSQVNGIGETPSTAGLDDPDPAGDLQPGDGLNVGEITGLRVCDLLRVSSDDLPSGALPGLDTLPNEAAPPGVPTPLLTSDALLGLALGPVPGGCEVVNLNDPQLDPTDPPSDPDQTAMVKRFERRDGGTTATLYYFGTLDQSADDGPSIKAKPGWYITSDTQDVRPRFVLTAERSEYGLGDSLGSEPVIRRNEDDVQLRGLVLLVDRRAGVDAECNDLREFDGDLGEENLADLGPCEYELVGLPQFITPERAVRILSDATSEPPTDPGSLPVDPDELLNL